MDWNALYSLGVNEYFLLLLYPLLGAGIKYIDAAFDDDAFDQRLALLSAILLGLLWSFAMCTNSISATLLFAVVLSVFLKGKIDNKAFLLGFGVIVFLMLFCGVQLALLPLGLLTIAGVLDEVGNDVIDYNQGELKESKFGHQFIKYFFGRRYVMKAALLVLVIIGTVPILYLIAFILFDEAYIVIDMYGETRKKRNMTVHDELLVTT